MRRKILISTLAISAFAVLSTPMTAFASELKPVAQGNGYVVYMGQSTDCLQETLDKICNELGNINNFCPVLPELPDGDVPTTPDVPDDNTPDIDTPNVDTPDVDVPTTPDVPDDNTPDSSNPDNGIQDDEAVSSYAQQILNLVNEERAKAGLSPVSLDLNITAAANIRAKEIVTNFSHTRPNGTSFSTVLKEQGISYRGSGKNIAWGQKSPEQVMNGWMNSDGHRANILNADFQNLGVGHYQDENGVNYWVQLFTY